MDLGEARGTKGIFGLSRLLGVVRVILSLRSNCFVSFQLFSQRGAGVSPVHRCVCWPRVRFRPSRNFKYAVQCTMLGETRNVVQLKKMKERVNCTEDCALLPVKEQATLLCQAIFMSCKDLDNFHSTWLPQKYVRLKEDYPRI